MNDVTTIPRKSTSRSEDVRRLFRDRRSLLAAVIVLAAAVVLIAWLVTSGDDDKASEVVAGPVAAAPVEPVALSASGLKTLANAVGEPIYWAGPLQGFLYELRRTKEGNTYVRYLPPGVDAGAGAGYLTIATYPFPDALAALEKVAGDRGIELEGGGLALVAAGNPTSVHLAYPGVDYQVEVYDPSPERAIEVARSGDVRPAE